MKRLPRRKIPLSSPDITNLEIKAVTQVLKTQYLSRGPKIKEFEEKIAKYINVPYAIAVNSGTSALHLAVRAIGLKEGDEVITTPFSFISSSNCLLMERARPVFVDIDPLTYNINPKLIEEKVTVRTKAILPVDIFGNPCEIDKIKNITEKYNLAVIEDACEAMGAEYKDEKVGKEGDIATFGFYPNKQITTGEGGMILTSSKDLADLCRSMRNHGNSMNKWADCERLGYNYWMDEMSAALGLIQFSRLDEILKKRKNVAAMYVERLKDIEGITLPYERDNIKKSWLLFDIRIHKNRDKVIEKLKNYGIDSRAYFPAVHLQPFYREKFGYKEGDFPVTEELAGQNLALPFYNNLKKEDIDYIGEKLEEIIR